MKCYITKELVYIHILKVKELQTPGTKQIDTQLLNDIDQISNISAKHGNLNI